MDKILVNLKEYLKPTYFIDSDSKMIIDLAKELAINTGNNIERAKNIFYWTRDKILYNPYESFTSKRENYKASHIIAVMKGWCVQKACVLAALSRALEIPSRLHFADIRNHQVPKKLKDAMKTDLFVFHGYTELFLNGNWFKATPAFNITMCQKLGLKTVEFNGINIDKGMLPEKTPDSHKYIEYVKDRGVYSDFPFKEIFKTIIKYYNMASWEI